MMRQKRPLLKVSQFKAHIENFMRKNPLIKEIGWTQYTPYFNDGDSCVFHVYDINFRCDYEKLTALAAQHRISENENVWDDIISKSYEDIRDGHSSYDISEYRKDNPQTVLIKSVPELYAAYNAFIEFEKDFQSIPDEIFLNMFGDHAQITVDIDNFSIVSYEHE